MIKKANDEIEVLSQTVDLDLCSPIELRDWDAYTLFTDAVTMKYLTIPNETEFKENRKTKRKKNLEDASWTVDAIHRSSGDFIGVSGFRCIDNGVAEFGVVIAHKWQRRGFLKQLWNASLRYAAAHPNIHTIIARTSAENLPMRTFLESQTHLILQLQPAVVQVSGRTTTFLEYRGHNLMS